MSKGLMVAVPVVLVALVAGLGFAGVVKIPGITPQKAKANAQAGYADKDEKGGTKAVAKKPAPPVKKVPPLNEVKKPPTKLAISKDPEKGAEALAAVWNEVKVPELIRISESWKDPELAQVLGHMDTSKVAKLLGSMAKGDEAEKLKPNPARASKLSKLLQDIGSTVTPES